MGKDPRVSRAEHSSGQTWLDTARSLPTGIATPAQMRQSMLPTGHHELPAPNLWGDSTGATHRDSPQVCDCESWGNSLPTCRSAGCGEPLGYTWSWSTCISQGVQIWGPTGLWGEGERKFCGRIIEGCSLTFCKLSTILVYLLCCW